MPCANSVSIGNGHIAVGATVDDGTAGGKEEARPQSECSKLVIDTERSRGYCNAGSLLMITLLSRRVAAAGSTNNSDPVSPPADA
jgi:hypothetical protein